MTDGELQMMLRAIAREDREEPSDRVEHAVMHQWDERRTRPPARLDETGDTPVRAIPWIERAIAVAGVAACVMLIAWTMTRPVPESPAPISAPAASAMAEEVLTVDSEIVNTGEPIDTASPSVTRRPPPMVRTQSRPVEHGSRIESFTSLHPLSDADLVGARMARVRLSAPAAERLGLVDIRVVTEGSIEADVLLGEDGMARAIRIVR